MKSIFNEDAYNDITRRIAQLLATSKAEWGSMSAAQMFHHCQKPIEVALGKLPIKTNWLFKYFSRPFKSMLYNDRAWRKGLPTVPEFLVKDEKDFDREKKKLTDLIYEYHQLKTEHHFPPHPVFGKFTKQQWGQMQYKHLDHHLRQFGV